MDIEPRTAREFYKQAAELANRRQRFKESLSLLLVRPRIQSTSVGVHNVIPGKDASCQTDTPTVSVQGISVDEELLRKAYPFLYKLLNSNSL